MFINSSLSKKLVNSKNHLILNTHYNPCGVTGIPTIVLDSGLEFVYNYVFGMHYLYGHNNAYDNWHIIYFNKEVSYDLYEAVDNLYKDFDVFLNSKKYINGEAYIFNHIDEKFCKIKKYLNKYLSSIQSKITYCNAMIGINTLK